MLTGHDEVLGYTHGRQQDPTLEPLPRITKAYVYQNGSWRQVSWAIAPIRDLSDLAVTPAGDGWAVGRYDIVWSEQNAEKSFDDRDASGSALLHYTEGA
ncbi:MAG TPA: hypothetical protein VGP82_18995 [Ktedonobacterales bacterium]|jgi:hypothetical protein|nr:hypothetical protein [Ktedonobacterales bacterium]